MIKYIKQHLVTTISIALAVTGTVAAQAGVIPGINNNQAQPNTSVTEQQLKELQTGGGVDAADPQKPAAEQPAPGGGTSAPGDTAPTDEGGTPPTNPAPVAPSEPVDTPAPVVPAAPTVTGHTMRFVDVSPADQPNTKAAEYCDYHYSDGSTQPTWVATITKQGGFSQAIASYSETNPPGNYSPC